MVSSLGFGGLGVLDRYISSWSTHTGRDVAVRLFEFVLDSGINFVDTARWYEDSEERLGEVIASRRADCVIASKTLKRDRAGARDEVHESLRQLQTDHIDVYLLHHIQWPEELDKAIADGGALEGLLEAKKNGEIRFIGISGHDPDILGKAISTGYFDVIELPYNALDYAIFRPVVDLAVKLDVGVLTMKALAAGKIADSPDKVDKALKFALCVKGIASVIVGLSTIEQVRFNVEIAGQVQQWLAEEKQRVLADIMQLPSDYWGIDSQYYEAKDCPLQVPIAEVLRLERYRTIYKNGHRTKWEYSQLPVKADGCAACPGYCERPSPYGLSVRAILANAHENLSISIADREILQHGGEIVR
jgi:predicted aldo/keto reductase-like oxidoreductase